MFEDSVKLSQKEYKTGDRVQGRALNTTKKEDRERDGKANVDMND